MIKLKDRHNRLHDYLRISLTDKCNLNCSYCNPKNNYLSEKKEILSFEELRRIIIIFVKYLGIRKIRFTGGEPFARKDIIDFFRSLDDLKREYKLSFGLTTNGTMINGRLKEIKEAGIDDLNISLDTLDPEKFIKLTGRDELKHVLSSIEEAQAEGFRNLKLNSVIIKCVNDDEIKDFIKYFFNSDLQFRFIEFMPSSSNTWNNEGFISAADIKKIIEEEYLINKSESKASSVAKNYKINGSPLSIGLITPISEHFCGNCNRVRITASGLLKTCLFNSRNEDINFKNLINFNYSDEDICALIVSAFQLKWKKHPGIGSLALFENNMISTGG